MCHTIASMQHSDRRGRGGGHRHNHHRPQHDIQFTYQTDLIRVQVAVDPGDLKLASNASNAGTAAATPTYTIEFTPDEAELNAAKDALGNIGAEADRLGKSRGYMEFRRAMDMYAGLRGEILRIGGEKNATNAFLKYYEMAYEFYPFGDAPRRVTAFFNAELPGSSMVAFNHYMRTVHPRIDYQWYASSLMAPDLREGSHGLSDQYGYYAKNRSRWMMGGDSNDGDMTSVDNILDVAARLGPASDVGGVDIYSHDAGIDVSGAESGEVRYDIQEDANMWLHLGCAIAGLLTMRTGALFIAKQYTLYRTFTWNLILFYSTLFERFYLTKPLSSRPTNSEIYLVGVGFRGVDRAAVDVLVDRLRRRDSTPLWPQPAVRLLPAVASLQKFVRIVHGQQRNMMLEMVRLNSQYTPAQIADAARGIKRELNQRWLRKYPVHHISAEDRVPSA